MVVNIYDGQPVIIFVKVLLHVHTYVYAVLRDTGLL